MRWYYRFLLTTLPIFVIISIFLLISFFYILVIKTENETAEANRTLNEQVLNIIDNTLKEIDYLATKEILYSEEIHSFLREDKLYTDKNATYTNYRTITYLKELQSSESLIDSIYIVRLNDGILASPNSITSVESYNDSSFIKKVTESNFFFKWTTKRDFNESTYQEGKEVVSLVRYATVANGLPGIMVININLNSIKELVSSLYNHDITFINLRDQHNNIILGSANEKEIISNTESGYTGWKIESGLKEGIYAAAISGISSLWILVIGLSIVLGIILIIYLTNHNFKPIDNLLRRVFDFNMITNAFENEEKNYTDIKVIEKTIDQMIEQTNEYELDKEKYIEIRRKDFFNELVRGTYKKNLDINKWNKEKEKNEIPIDWRESVVCVFEIDSYTSLDATEQSKFKNSLPQVLYEIEKQNKLILWMDWVSEHRLSCIVQTVKGEVDLVGTTLDFLTHIIHLVEGNFPYTVTVGLGDRVKKLSSIHISYNQAVEALEFKMVNENNKILYYKDLTNDEFNELYNYLERVRDIVHLLIRFDNGWRNQYNVFIDEIKKKQLTRSEIISLMNYIGFYIDRELKRLDINSNKSFLSDFPNPDQYEILSELDNDFNKALSSLEENLKLLQEQKSSFYTIQEIKNYLEENFDDPNLSLIHLSDKFQISDKYVSKLFKSYYGIKFVDFLIGLRMRQSKLFLEKTDFTIKEIAEKVGYTSSISFSRTFKKLYNLTPGEFRKRNN
ncbi:helix-turn-helix domain-containing protein [Gracilibacillus sp. YIM 98692]|uniref:AraC family transcriptional regulator n=1 Tax=Gracilibacillus sp. YIM 98692 TaxID=2663532 RepID=UPI0013D3DE92|nr:helix-turn-helix domain-containing protein [Gracilibacillus sp. YIM 98692]